MVNTPAGMIAVACGDDRCHLLERQRSSAGVKIAHLPRNTKPIAIEIKAMGLCKSILNPDYLL